MSSNPLIKLLSDLPGMGASDLHIATEMPVMVRINGELKPLDTPPLSAKQCFEMLVDILSPEQKQHFKKNWDLDFSYHIPGVGRYRANVFRQRKGTDGVFRYIPEEIPSPAKLGLPDALVKLLNNHQGLVLITGPTRSGKTTTLASLIHYINQQRDEHIITVEDPIEFVFPKAKALINQREVGRHTKSTEVALRGALREDPDIIMVGEMRDLETMRLAITAAETGHLVISTLQTQSSHKTVDRIIDSFPAEEASQIRTMLSESIKGIVSQQLIPNASGSGVVLASEVLLATSSLSNLIREGKTFQIPSIMQMGANLGMKKMDHSIAELFHKRLITKETAMKRAFNPKELAQLLEPKKVTRAS